MAGALVLLVAGLALGACGGGETKPATQARTLTPPSATVTTPTVPTTPIDPVPTATTPTVPRPTTPTTSTPTTTPAPPTTVPTTPAPTAPTPSAASSCGSVAGGFISDIRGLSVGCAEARATARDWLRGVQASGKPQGSLPANGLSCRGRCGASARASAAPGRTDRST